MSKETGQTILHRAAFQLESGDQAAALKSMEEALTNAPLKDAVMDGVKALLEQCEESDDKSRVATLLHQQQRARRFVTTEEDLAGITIDNSGATGEPFDFSKWLEP